MNEMEGLPRAFMASRGRLTLRHVQGLDATPAEFVRN